MLVRDVGIDLGTVNTLIHVHGRGLVLAEPSVVAVDTIHHQVVAVGQEAVNLLGSAPAHVVAVHPLAQGVIADLTLTEIMLREFLRTSMVGGRGIIRPRVAICVPTAVTSVEKRALMDAVLGIGARRVIIIEEPLAAALGAGLNIFEPGGHLVVDIGGGTTDVAVLSLGGIVVSDSIRVGGNAMNAAVIDYIRHNFRLLIGESTAEAVKIMVGEAHPGACRRPGAEVRGRDIESGIPRTVTIEPAHVREAIASPLEEIVRCVRRVLRRTPPELAGDIIDRGLLLTGGGSLMPGMDRLLAEATGVPAHIAESPMSCVAVGTGLRLTYSRWPKAV